MDNLPPQQAQGPSNVFVGSQNSNKNLLQKIGHIFSRLRSRKLLAIIGFFFIIIVVSLVVFSSGQRQDIRQRAAEFSNVTPVTRFKINNIEVNTQRETEGSIYHQIITTGINRLKIDHKFDYFQYYQLLTPDYLRNQNGDASLTLEGEVVMERTFLNPPYPSFANLQIELLDPGNPQNDHKTIAQIANRDIWGIGTATPKTFTVPKGKSIVIYIRAINAQAFFSRLKLLRQDGSNEINIWGAQHDEEAPWQSGKFHNAANDVDTNGALDANNVPTGQPYLQNGTVRIIDDPNKNQAFSCLDVIPGIPYKVTGTVSSSTAPNYVAPYPTFAGVAVDEMNANCTYAGPSHALNEEFIPTHAKIAIIPRALNSNATFSDLSLSARLTPTSAQTPTNTPQAPSLTRCANVSAPVPSTQGVVGITKVSYPDCNSNINAAMQQIKVLVGNTDSNNAFQEIPISTGSNGLAPGEQHVVRIVNVPAGYGVGYTACDMTRAGQCRTNPITAVNISGGTGNFNVEVPGSSSVVDVVVYLAPPSQTAATPVPPTLTPAPTNTPIPGPIVSRCTASPATVAVGETVTYTMATTGRISSWGWESSNASGFVVTSTSRNQPNITARFSNDGVKRVVATVLGVDGTDSRPCTPVTVNPAATSAPTTAQSIRVTSPNGGESLIIGQPFTIRWTQNLVNKVRIWYVHKNGDVSLLTPANDLPTTGPNDDFSWTPPASFAGKIDGKIRILAYPNATQQDDSDGTFTVAAASTPTPVPLTLSCAIVSSGQQYVGSAIEFRASGTGAADGVLSWSSGTIQSVGASNRNIQFQGRANAAGTHAVTVTRYGTPTGTISASCPSVTVAAASTPTPTPVSPPAAPTNVVAVPGCNGRGPGSKAYISITWRGPAEADFYDLATSDEAVVIRNLTSGTYIFTDAAYNGNQYFKVRSARSGIKSAYTASNTINQADCTQPIVTNTPIPPTPTPIPAPAAPTNVVAVPGCNGRGPGSKAYISITWRGPAEADFYDLATSDEAVVIRNLTSGTYIFTDAAYNGNQYFKVRSARSGIKSAYTASNTINQADCTQPIVTNTPIPPTPTPIVVTQVVTQDNANAACQPLPKSQGNANNDCVISILDFNIWSSSYGSTTDLRADFNNNGKIDIGDFNIWRRNRVN